MKRKNKEEGCCRVCNSLTHKQVPKPKGMFDSNKSLFYCGCKGVVAI